MAAVIRVKRFLDEEPLNALVLNCKKRKTVETSTDKECELQSTVLKFAGTLKNQDEDIYPHLSKKSTKNELEDEFKKHNVDLSAKLREQKILESKNSRYKIVNCFRSQNINAQAESSSVEDTELTVYDIETTNESSEKIDNNYVYDLYYTSSDDLGDSYLEEYVSVYPLSEDLVFDSTRGVGATEVDSEDSSEDSNAENNWRNDYPDESDMESVNEDDMVAAMGRVDLDDLSSDDGEEGFVYSIDSEAAGFEEDIDESDVQRYGERYARFRARHNKDATNGFNKDLYCEEIDDDPDEEDSS